MILSGAPAPFGHDEVTGQSKVRWSGKLSREARPAGRQVLRAEQGPGRGGDHRDYLGKNFLSFLPLSPLCARRSVITPAAWNLRLFFLSLAPPRPPPSPPSSPCPLGKILLMLPLLPRRCSSAPKNALHLPSGPPTCGPTRSLSLRPDLEVTSSVWAES